MTESDAFLVDQRIAQTALVQALVLYLSLHEYADEVRVVASMRDGRVSDASVEYRARGEILGGFGS